ncbi:MAG: hypothetical protein UHH95_04330 [Oscillospiraceae bacterium]|nr:hypothetical protein [Oscillospiraceae bacterium]
MIKAIPNAKPLTDAETIKALECCMDNSIKACEKCPIDKHIKDDCACCRYLAENALNLINELKNEYCKLMQYLVEQAPTVEMPICAAYDTLQIKFKPKIIAHIDGEKIDITEYMKEV